jgi:hypothetical protein
MSGSAPPSRTIATRRAALGSAVAAVAVAVTAAGVVVAVPPAEATTGGIAVTSVGGQQVRDGAVPRPVSGAVDVLGSAQLGDPPAPPARPLVADAGDSPFVTAGARAVLVGAAFGGTAPYSWRWTSPVGSLTGADSASAELDTTGVAAATPCPSR